MATFGWPFFMQFSKFERYPRSQYRSQYRDMTLAQSQEQSVQPAEVGRTPAPIISRLVDRLRPIVRALRSARDRTLHDYRRTQARRAAAAATPVRSVVFVCHGNVCRSPFAEAVFRRLARQTFAMDVAVASAGFIGPGRGSPEPALAAATRRGYDMSSHRSALVATSALADADLIVVMAANQAAAIRKRSPRAHGTILILGDFDPQQIDRRTIQDPWGGDDALFDESFARVERCVGELFRVIANASAAHQRG